jgi:hypothetical protein
MPFRDTEQDYDLRRILKIFSTSISIGIIGLTLYVADHANLWSRDVSETLGATILLAGAFLLLGALTGFLFGVPRVRSTSDSSNSETSKSPLTFSLRGYQANTNLEQISDWLTKIIVGCGGG